MDVLDNKCPACGAKITFNPKNQMWDCEYCGSKFSLEQMQQYNNASSISANVQDKPFKKLENMDVYKCKNCGAEVMADEATTATFCVYCGSTAILKDKIMDGIAPTKLIPFKKVKEDAVNAFKNLSKGKPLMPKLFNNPDNVKKISGVYIPFWSYDFGVQGNISFNASDIKRWKTYNYEYIKTDRYLCKRGGKLDFNGVLVDGSTRFADDLMDSLEPFDYNDLVEYNHAYLSGFLAEKYDVSSDKAISRADKRVMNTTIDVMKDSVLHQTRMVAKNDMKITKKNCDYILLPVWMVNVKYKNKDYTFAMNGQTGEIVGDIPIDIVKTIVIGILLFVVITAIAFLLFYFVR